jgi:hypothetical protein
MIALSAVKVIALPKIIALSKVKAITVLKFNQQDNGDRPNIILVEFLIATNPKLGYNYSDKVHKLRLWMKALNGMKIKIV